MKPLFLLLCLLNVAYFLWQFHAGRIDTADVVRTEDAGGLLTVEEFKRARRGAQIAALVRDGIQRSRQAELAWILADLHGQPWQLPVEHTLKPRQPKKVAEKPLRPAQQTIVRKCFEAGPFADEAGVKIWLGQKALTGKQILQRERTVASDFQVYYPAAKTAEQTLANKMMLKDKGLQDIWLIAEGDKKGAISLGVFRDVSRALVFKTQLAARGIASEIRQRDKTEARWFAKVMLDKADLKQYEAPGIGLSACTDD